MKKIALGSGLAAVLIVLAVLVSGCSGGGGSVAPASPAGRLQGVVDYAWEQYKQAHGLPGGGIAVYLVTPSGNYYASSGMASGIDQNTRFRIASNTKTFTSAAIMLLHQQGRLNIDDTIVSSIPGRSIPYVPETAQYAIPYKSSITIRQLLSHTAGVYDIDNNPVPSSCTAVPYAGQNYPGYVLDTDPRHQFSPAELVGVDAVCQASHFVPGADYHYSDTGYSMLAAIIEQISGLSYDQFLFQNLIVPNGLSSTSVVMLGTDQTIPAPYNPGYIYSNGTTTDVTQDNMSLHIGEGNVTSTPAELARWVRRLVRGEAGVDAALVAIMGTPTAQSQARNSGYGFGIASVPGLGLGHSGANQGYLSLMVHDPGADVTTIIYFNVWDSANLGTSQTTLMMDTARSARAAVGY